MLTLPAHRKVPAFKVSGGGWTPYFGVNFSPNATGVDNESHDAQYTFTDTGVWHTLTNGNSDTLRVKAETFAPSYFDNATAADERLDSYGFRSGVGMVYFDFELPADTYIVDGALGAASFSGSCQAEGFNGLDTTLQLFDNGPDTHVSGEWFDMNIVTKYSDTGWFARDPETEGIQIVITDRSTLTGFRLRNFGGTSAAWRLNYVRFYTQT